MSNPGSGSGSGSERNPSRLVWQTDSFLKLSIPDRVLALHAEITKDPNFFGFDTHTLKDTNISLISASPNRTTWEMDVPSHLCNKSANLHGGAAATLLDNLTSTALMTIARPGFLDGGHVSRTITMSYLRPVPKGSHVTVDCEVQAAGRNTANIVGKVYLNGKLIDELQGIEQARHVDTPSEGIMYTDGTTYNYPHGLYPIQ
ncbi:hypothetical protein LTR20_005093 [Exophiala xenobiotica]|nr:hypothetical protein LTR40_007790 [Exophiala xenobiotica]KAK5325631.1 hypothetical protein LTR93_003851 [Exophiala xenobiotica]KAK5398000.1 hypothetical protein LTR79_004282 [Exophiala xenobiotica]KAK5407220.1 hypothetical protein LTR06_007962 [Exophiala xenobiotica]KAK5417930.1 hypothetical protein LTR90_005104 [Exophiala xenobiotica]